MGKSLKRVAVTGGAGQIAYSLLFRLASGELTSSEEPIALHILETPSTLDALRGVVMELEDCAFPLLKEIHIGSDPYEIFEGVHYAFLVGAKPRGPGMERKDLLSENAKIFIEQGKALNEKASSDALVLVVGNPCNTNCLIALHHAPKLDRSQFFAMTLLDQNRASAMIAKKAGVLVEEVKQLAIWGNHSSTQVVDFFHGKISGKPILEQLERKWLETDFLQAVQKRGAEVIAARGKSSAASAAHAAIGAMQALVRPTPKGEWFSVALYSRDNPYGIDPNLVFSFPTISKGAGRVEIVRGLDLDPFLKEKIALTEKELIEERKYVGNLI